MKTYRNRVTGAVIDVPCALDGSDWEEVTEAKAKKAAPAEKPAKEATKAAPKKTAAKKG